VITLSGALLSVHLPIQFNSTRLGSTWCIIMTLILLVIKTSQRKQGRSWDFVAGGPDNRGAAGMQGPRPRGYPSLASHKFCHRIRTNLRGPSDRPRRSGPPASYAPDRKLFYVRTRVDLRGWRYRYTCHSFQTHFLVLHADNLVDSNILILHNIGLIT
jgi:hypothetical protein